jgi:TrpR-related protein YerC/YecD
MKRRAIAPDMPPQQAAASLAAALASLRTPEQVIAFLEDLCTPAEIEALSDRWRVVPLLVQGLPYRDIHERTGVSVTTIGRVARCLAEGIGYRHAVRALGLDAAQAPASPRPRSP